MKEKISRQRKITKKKKKKAKEKKNENSHQTKLIYSLIIMRLSGLEFSFIGSMEHIGVLNSTQADRVRPNRI